jgi:hypothetical protein
MSMSTCCYYQNVEILSSKYVGVGPCNTSYQVCDYCINIHDEDDTA